MQSRLIALAPLLLLISIPEARADDSTRRELARAALHRARRSIAIGPTAGAGVAYAWSPGEVDVPVSAGLAFLWVDALVPEADEVMRMALERDFQRHDRTLEKPKLAIVFEGTFLPRAGAGQLRLTVAAGVSKVTVGPTVVTDFAGENGLFVGGELGLHLTPWAGGRASVIDLFARADFGVTSGTDGADQVTVGTRYLLDLL